MGLTLLGILVFFMILFFIIRSAVREGIIDAYNAINSSGSKKKEGYSITKIICPNCGEKYDMDYPKCPSCKHNTELKDWMC